MVGFRGGRRGSFRGRSRGRGRLDARQILSNNRDNLAIVGDARNRINVIRKLNRSPRGVFRRARGFTSRRGGRPRGLMRNLRNFTVMTDASLVRVPPNLSFNFDENPSSSAGFTRGRRGRRPIRTSPLSRTILNRNNSGLQTNRGNRIRIRGRKSPVKVQPVGPGNLFLSAIREAQYSQEESSLVDTDISMEEEAPALSTRLGPPRTPRPPISGHRVLISNLSNSVTVDDIQELCSSIGPLQNWRLIEKGLGEAVFQTRKDALKAIAEFNQRELDGIPMQMQLMQTGAQSGQKEAKIELDSQEADHVAYQQKLTKMMENPTEEGPEPDKALISQALFQDKNKGGGVTFTVKI